MCKIHERVVPLSRRMIHWQTILVDESSMLVGNRIDHGDA